MIVAAGRGARMNSPVPKQFLPLAGKPVLAHAIGAFSACARIDRIVLVAASGDLSRIETSILPSAGGGKPLACVEGGEQRQDSVYRGLVAAGNRTRIAVIHDGVRPLIRPDQIDRVLSVAENKGAAILAARAFDTLKTVSEDGRIGETLDRRRIWAAQTPQAFRFGLIWEAHEKARQAGISATDDAQLLERAGVPVWAVEDDGFNLKITTARDLTIAEALLADRAQRT